MQSPIKIVTTDKEAIADWAFVDRQSALLTIDQIFAQSAYQLDTTSVYGGDPVLQVPQTFQSYKNAILSLKATGQMILSVGGQLRQITTDIAIFGYTTPTLVPIKIDGAPLQYGFYRDSDSVVLSSTPSQIDLTSVPTIFSVWSSYNNVSFPADVGAVHRFQILIQAQLLASK